MSTLAAPAPGRLLAGRLVMLLLAASVVYFLHRCCRPGNHWGAECAVLERGAMESDEAVTRAGSTIRPSG